MKERREEKLLKNTIKEEQIRLSKVVRRIGSKLSGLMMTCGFLVSIFGIYLIIKPPDPILSIRLNIIFTAALGLIGILNILCGLLLLLGEE